MRDPAERLRDILDAIANIERYAARGKQAFESDELIQNWFVRHLQIIGEATYALPRELRDQRHELGRISSGAAAKLAGIPRTLFLTKLADYGVDTFKLNEQELQQEHRLA
jgi:predicted HTH domain antitoxin